MIKISAIVTTARLGGLDVLVNSFRQQTLLVAEWELIVVDEYWEQRKNIFESAQLPIKHIRPKRYSDVYDNSTGFNSGLAIAAGELVTFLVDYCWVYAGYLENHWHWYQKYKGFSMTGYVDRYTPPPLKLEGSQLWSTFSQVFDASYANWFFPNNTPEYQERKGGVVGPEVAPGVYEMPGHLVYMLGDSIPLSVIKELNGWDEAYNGGYGSNDIDIGMRANMIGWRFALNPASIIYKLGTPTSSQVLPAINKQRVRSPQDNFQILLARMEAIKAARETVAVPAGRGAWR